MCQNKDTAGCAESREKLGRHAQRTRRMRRLCYLAELERKDRLSEGATRPSEVLHMQPYRDPSRGFTQLVMSLRKNRKPAVFAQSSRDVYHAGAIATFSVLNAMCRHCGSWVYPAKNGAIFHRHKPLHAAYDMAIIDNCTTSCSIYTCTCSLGLIAEARRGLHQPRLFATARQREENNSLATLP
jgi:hypothetical protein